MDAKFIEQMEKRLLEMKQEIIRNLIQENSEVLEILETQRNPKDIAELASDDTDIEILDKISANDKKKLQLILSALSRIKNGNYGRCLKTGKLISKERLEALPYALFCIQVQQEIDKRKRRN
ncbi:MAG: TraR/DksA family transcriptional regulator [Spirochaetales bacterium]|nr:TraR/DksA family transcriptional regulator [Spirochaetales bacterium]